MLSVTARGHPAIGGNIFAVPRNAIPIPESNAERHNKGFHCIVHYHSPDGEQMGLPFHREQRRTPSDRMARSPHPRLCGSPAAMPATVDAVEPEMKAMSDTTA